MGNRNCITSSGRFFAAHFSGYFDFSILSVNGYLRSFREFGIVCSVRSCIQKLIH